MTPKDHAADVVVVSFHEKGFWQGDLYVDARDWDDHDWSNGAVPDGFFTMKRGCTEDEAVAKAEKTWPGARIDAGLELCDEEE
ncbi:hypothetical protein [Aquamicrobium sp.]|uniref:hypothetical protein n=1 Tax=Aquamicrobium sp. TaxID=1872579 RepID=UPI00258E4190|nr:hypothetical protein [Aquamicrobium sp.]MCK9549148.1 hypothetical protein [Aquamicrobium sp.]